MRDIRGIGESKGELDFSASNGGRPPLGHSHAAEQMGCSGQLLDVTHQSGIGFEPLSL
jgi:hypothetical protein